MEFSKIFKPKNWSRLTRLSSDQNDNLRRDILFSQIIVVGLIISVFHLINDLHNNYDIAYYIDALFILTLGIFYYLNEKGSHWLAKFLHLTSLNTLIFLLASILDEKVRMEYNFFPMVILAFLVFYKTELIWSILFSIFSFILVLVLEVTDYMPFGDILAKQGMDSITFFINIVGAFILLVMGLVFLVRLNQITESELIKNESSLRKINEELDRFVYSASHDLRAPLLSIKGLTSLMRKEKAGLELGQYIEMIEDRINNLDSFIEEIINYSRNSREEVKKEEIHLKSVIDQVYEKLKYIEGTSDIKLIINLKVKSIVSDRSRLNIILSNLLANSIRYSDHEKKEHWIEISSYEKNESKFIEVKDNGIGIKEIHLNQIFNMFYRATSNSDGSGIGLYIVSEMVDKIGGNISVKSSMGEGTSFILQLAKD